MRRRGDLYSQSWSRRRTLDRTPEETKLASKRMDGILFDSKNEYLALKAIQREVGESDIEFQEGCQNLFGVLYDILWNISQQVDSAYIPRLQVIGIIQNGPNYIIYGCQQVDGLSCVRELTRYTIQADRARHVTTMAYALRCICRIKSVIENTLEITDDYKITPSQKSFSVKEDDIPAQVSPAKTSASKSRKGEGAGVSKPTARTTSVTTDPPKRRRGRPRKSDKTN